MPQLGWSLDKSVWERVSKDALENNWRQNSFIFEASSLLRAMRGIYIITNQAKHLTNNEPFCNFQTPLYVGHSININKRFKQHTSGKSDDSIFKRIFEFREHCRFWYQYMPNASKEELRAREQELINIFGSPLNRINSVAQQRPVFGHFIQEGD